MTDRFPNTIGLNSAMMRAMEAAQRELPGTGLILFTFDVGTGRLMGYVSNSEGEAPRQAMEEWIREKGQRG